MNQEDFVRAVKQVVSDNVGVDMAEYYLDPPGRKPSVVTMRRSNWFKSQSTENQRMVSEFVTEAAEVAVFGLFCVLDGVRAVEGMGAKSDFYLTAEKDGKVTQLNGAKLDFLHDIFQSLRHV